MSNDLQILSKILNADVTRVSKNELGSLVTVCSDNDSKKDRVHNDVCSINEQLGTNVFVIFTSKQLSKGE